MTSALARSAAPVPTKPNRPKLLPRSEPKASGETHEARAPILGTQTAPAVGRLDLDMQVVPEPGIALSMASALAALVARRRMR